MNLKEINFEITGIRSLLMHSDNVILQDALTKARKTPGKKGTPGDDRDPSWTWKTYLYSDGEHVCLPTLALMSMLRKGGTDFKGQGRKSLKADSQSSISFADEYVKLTTHQGKLVTIKSIDAIDNDAPFDEQAAAAEALGFVLDVRRVVIGDSKHVRVRPRFLPGWKIRSMALVDIDRIAVTVFTALLEYCGNYVGLGDWRPSAKHSPGQHGRFTAEVL